MFTENNKTMQCGFGSTNAVEFNSVKAELEDRNMSLVGIMKTKFGVVAFGDSKSSYFYDETRRPSQRVTTVQKVFKKNNLLLVTWGDNEVRLKKGSIISLSELINAVLTKLDNPTSFCECFQNKLLQLQADKEQYFNFYIAYKDPEGDYCITRQTISKYEIQRSLFTYQYGMYWAGHGGFAATGMPINNEWSISEAKTVATFFVESAIKLAEICEGETAPIGGPVQIETLPHSNL